MHHRSLSLYFIASAMLLLQGCAVTLDNGDVFTLRDKHSPPAVMQLEPDLDRARVAEVTIDAGTRRFLGYRFAAPSPKRALIFFPGNGYGAPAALSRIARVFGDSQTDVYILSYGQPDEVVPSVSQVYEMGSGIAGYAAATSGIPPTRVIAIGHSLGGWVALKLASTHSIGCAVVVGTGTTAAETAAHLVPKPLSWFATFRPTPDVALLNNIDLAKQSRVPTLVVGSEADDVMPSDRSRTIFGQLGSISLSELYVSSSATHGGYFRDIAVVEKIHAFMRTRCDA